MPKPLAVQLYTFRDPARFGGAGMGLDPESLEAIAEVGFLGVETVDVPGGDPVEARRALDAVGLSVASSHTWSSLDDLGDFERVSAGIAELGSRRIIVSHRDFGSIDAIDAYADQLGAAAAVAGRHGLTLAHHNHSAEMRPVDGVPAYRRLVDRLDPAVAIQVDIFWVVVGGADPAEVVAELGERVVSLHIKDGIDLPDEAYDAGPFLNVPIGEGIVDPGAGDRRSRRRRRHRVAHRRVRSRRRSAHRRRPRELRAPGRARTRPGPRGVTTTRPARVGIVGCGDVTGLYLPGCARFPVIELAACADLDEERAAALSARGGFPAMSIEALLADPSIEVVLNLTPPTAHAAVSLAAIAAGKHVYTEKPLATTRADAEAILAAASVAGVRVGGAPDTFLGGGLQTARARIDAGDVGTPSLATAAVLHLGPERWHPNPAFFYGRGGGPLLDVGPYYVAALVSLLGPITGVAALGRGVGGERRVATGPRAGETFPVEVSTTVIASYTFASGVIGSLMASFDVVRSTLPHLEVHGTAGSLELGDPNAFDGAVRRRVLDGADWDDVPLTHDGQVGRGIGLADMIEAIRADRPARASGGFAYHVLDVLLATEEAAAAGATVAVASTTERPAPLDPR